VSDTPIMTEILSTPELLQILCELRTTAVLIQDKELFAQFSDAFINNPTKLYRTESPLLYLLQYRHNLIVEFFDVLKTEAEIRFLTVPDHACMFPKTPHAFSARFAGDCNPEDGEICPVGTAMPRAGEKTKSEADSMTIEEWNSAVIESLRKVQLDENEEGMTGDTATTYPSEWKLERHIVGLAGVPSLYNSGSIGFSQYQDTETVSTAMSVKELKPITANMVESKFKGVAELLDKVEKDTNKSTPKRPHKSKEEIRKLQRKQFDGFVRNLIADVENINKVVNIE